MVTQQQLDEGKLTYMLSYNDVDASGNVVVKSLSASAALTFTGTAPRLTVNRTIDPEVVRNGKTATVQYELYNSGNVEIKNIRVEENTSISANAQTVTSLAPGERKTIKFTATMRQKDLTSRGKVTYKAGDESLSQELPAVTIPKANPGLVLDEILTADQDLHRERRHRYPHPDHQEQRQHYLFQYQRDGRQVRRDLHQSHPGPRRNAGARKAVHPV